MTTCQLAAYLERFAHDRDCIRSTNSKYVAEMTERDLPIACELVYSSKYHNSERPSVLYTWGNRHSDILDFLEDAIAEDAARWGVPAALYEQLKAFLFNTEGTRMWLSPPRNNTQHGDVFPGAIYFEFRNDMFRDAHGPALCNLLRLIGQWHTQPEIHGIETWETLGRVMADTDMHGLLVSWNTDCHRVVGTDVYYIYSLGQQQVVMNTIRSYCPAAGRVRLLHVIDLIQGHGGRVFMKITNTGAFSVHIQGLSWDRMIRLEKVFADRGVIDSLSRRYVKAPNVFSVCYTADCTPYCSAYMQYRDMYL